MAAAPSITAQTNAAPAPLVLDGVTVIDVEHGARWREQRVVIVGTRIQALGRTTAVRVPPGARVVDARGKYLIPGLWDMHIHPAGFGMGEAQSHLVNAMYRQLLAGGITGIRDAGSPIPLDTFRVWKRELAAGRRLGPRLIVSGPSIHDTVDGCTRANRLTCAGAEGRHATYVTDPADVRHLVDSLKAAGADMIKAHGMRSRANYLALAAEARRVGIPFGGHLVQGLDGLEASDSGARILDHGLWADVCGDGAVFSGRLATIGDSLLSLTRCAAAAARLRRNHTWVTIIELGNPGLPFSADRPQLPKTFRQRALSYTPPNFPPTDAPAWRPLTAAERRELPTGVDWATAWAAVHGDSMRSVLSCQMARLVYAADVPWLPGPDFPSLGSVTEVHLALLYPVLCGVPPLWVLRAATVEPARALGLADSLGTVAAGKVADLVLLDGDPLEDIWNVSKPWAVVANGRYFDRAALDRLLVEAQDEWRTVGTIRAAEQAKAKAASAAQP